MKKFLLSFLCLVAMTMTGYATEATVTVADLGYANAADLTTIVVDENVTITFAQGSNSNNAPKYYDSGKAARCYAGNIITFSCSAGNMTEIVFNISNNGLKRLTDAIPSTGTSVTSAENQTITWTGDAAEVRFTVGETATYGTESGKPGQIHFESANVTYSGTAPAVAKPAFSIYGGTFYEPVEVEITCSTEGAAIYYTLDGSTPDAGKTRYEQAITISETATLKAIAIKDNEVSSISEATYTIESMPEVDDIAAFLATNTTGAAKNDVYRIGCPVTVMYQYNNYMYITDGTTSMQVYGSLNNTYSNGDVLEGICGSVGYYNGTYQMTPLAATFGQATPGTPVQPATVMVEDITADMVSCYVRIKNVVVDAEKKFTDATGTIDGYKRFDVELPAVGSDTYTVEGFVSIYKETIQIFPTKITNTTALNNTQATANRVYAANGYIKTTGNNETVSVYNVTGKLVATGMAGRDIKIAGKGIYIVKVGDKATKVVVR